jgi:hypothetical protein
MRDDPGLSARFQAVVPEMERRFGSSALIPAKQKGAAVQRLSEMELAGLEPATSWVRSKLASGKFGARRLRFAAPSRSWSEAPLGADSGGYLPIPLGFRHSPRLVPESKRALRRSGERPHSSAGRTSERPGLLHAGERVRARITRRPPAVMLAGECLRVSRSRGCRTRSSRVGKEQWSTARDASRDLATT